MKRTLTAAEGIYGLIGCLVIIAAKTLIDLSLGGTSSETGLSSDLFNQWVPFDQFIRDSVALGQFPLWNPYIALGTPLVAELGLGLFNPMTWPVFFFDAPLALFISQLAMILTAVAGMWFFLGHLRLATLARIPASIAFGLVVLTNSFLPSAGLSLSILPLILLATTELINRPHVSTAAILSLLLAMCFFAGLPNYFYYTGILLGCYSLTLCALLHDRQAGSVTVRRLLLLFAPVLLMLGLVAVQFLPTLELSLQSIRDVTSDVNSQYHQASMQADIYLLLENFFSAHSFNLYSIKLLAFERGLGYLSILPAFCVLALLDHHNRKVVVGLWLSMIFMTLFLAAEQFPVLGFMEKLPMASALRWNGRISDYIQVVAIILSAIGLSSFLQAVPGNTIPASAPARRWFKLLLTPLLLAQLAFIYHVNGLAPAFWMATGGTCLLIALALSGRPYRWTTFAVPAVVLLLTADMLIHRQNVFPTPLFSSGNDFLYSASRDATLRSQIERVKREQPYSRVLIYKKGPAFGYPVANIGLIYRLANVNAYAGFTLASWTNYLSTMIGKEVFDQAVLQTPLQAFMGTLNSHLLNILGENESILALASVSRFVTPEGSRPLVGAFPRVFVTRNFSVANDGADALEQVRQRLATPGPWVVLEKAPGTLQSNTRPSPDRAAIVKYQTNRVVVDAMLSAPGVLVLNDAWYPGWRVLVDGNRAELLRANTLFRAVALERGRHIVEFVYRPTSLYWGASLSAAGLVAVLFLIRRRRRQT